MKVFKENVLVKISLAEKEVQAFLCFLFTLNLKDG